MSPRQNQYEYSVLLAVVFILVSFVRVGGVLVNSSFSSPQDLTLHAVFFTYIPYKSLARETPAKISDDKEKDIKPYVLTRLSTQMQAFVDSGLYYAVQSFQVVLATDDLATYQSNTAQMSTADAIRSQTFNVRVVYDLVKEICPNALISIHFENKYEYEGIMAVWKTALRVPGGISSSHIVLYFHGKGTTSSANGRSMNEVIMTKYVIYQWKRAVSFFTRYPLINKVGIAQGEGGIMFGNFFWARASFLSQLVRPISSPNRFYFEDWLSKLETKWPKTVQDGEGQAYDFLHDILDFSFPDMHKDAAERSSKEAGHADGVSLCPPNLKDEGLGVFFERSGLAIPCWDKETLANGTVIEDQHIIEANMME